MDISCDIIHDVLPLYVEDMVSDATRKMVDEHLCGCDRCAKELGMLKKQQKLPLDTDTNSLERIGKSIQKRKLLTVLCVVMTIASLIWSTAVFLVTPYYLSAEEAIESVELREDGALAIDYAGHITGKGSYDTTPNDSCIYAYTSRYDWLQDRQRDKELEDLTQEELEAYIKNLYQLSEVTQKDWDRFYNIYAAYCFLTDQGRFYLSYISNASQLSKTEQEMFGDLTPSEHSYDLWYLSPDGTPETLLWGGGDGVYQDEYHYGDRSHIAEQYLLLFVLSLAAAVVSFTCGHFLGKWKRRELLIGLGIVFAGLAGAVLIAAGFDFQDVLGSRAMHWAQYIPSLFLLLASTALLWRRLYRMSHQ